MLCAIDIETRGLDSTQFVAGCIVKETGLKKIYYDRHEMWNELIQLGIKEKKRGKMLSVYAHNLQYDFYGIANLKDTNLKILSPNRPFIVSYEYNGKECIKFLDTMSFYRMSLAKVGEIIGIAKGETPNWLINNEDGGCADDYSIKQLVEMFKCNKDKCQDYLVQDCNIVLESIKYIRKKMGEDGVHMKRIYSMSQVAMGYAMNIIANDNETTDDDFWFNKKYRCVRRSIYREEIHGAYRGGRIECFKTGAFDDVNYIDVNSLYPYCAKVMRFPNLNTVRKIYEPLRVMKQDEILNKIGLSNVLIYNKNDPIGVLPVRTQTNNYYPGIGKHMIGTWTNHELKYAVSIGYVIKKMYFSILYDDGYNPLKNFVDTIYKNKVEAKNEFDRFLYKSIMNNTFGKFGQTRKAMEIVIDNVEEAESYIAKNYKILKGIGLNWMYQKIADKGKPKKYYSPIIPSLICAYGRVYMHKMMSKLPVNNLVYTDTDSIIYLPLYDGEGNDVSLEIMFPISNNLGEFKIESKNTKALIWGRKTYSVGDDIKIAGFSAKNMTNEEFEKGYVESKKMITISTTNDIKKIGTFVKEKRNLNTQLKEYENFMDIMHKQDIYVDYNIENIDYYIETLGSISAK